MLNYIYFPGFEVRDENWLKFALLYLNKLGCVIPYTENPALLERACWLIEETDLIELHSLPLLPQQEVNQAIIHEVQKLLTPDFRYSKLFGSAELIAKWRQPDSHDYLIVTTPAGEAWFDFCEATGLGTRVEDGLLMAKRFAFIYLMLLAQGCVAKEKEQNRNAALITDYQHMERLSLLAEAKHEKTKQNSSTFFHTVMSWIVPADLADISFKEIIALRHLGGYQRCQHQFQRQLAAFLSTIGSSQPDKEVIHDFFLAREELGRFFMGNATKIKVATWGAALYPVEELKSLMPSQLIEQDDIAFSKPRRGTFNQWKVRRFQTELAPLRQRC